MEKFALDGKSLSHLAQRHPLISGATQRAGVMVADGENKLTLVERIQRALVLLAFLLNTSETDCPVITQWFYSPVSEANLEKTGILQQIHGDFREYLEELARTLVSTETRNA
ncbi:hypothetical protein [Afipia sp. DC4300-2b1]|jgi:hypothetical protein|uniref:hypothetical protein n=1 Tax=Afipia sp. DC4300-2b1 TaxID=2804672 RepID=UPI003CE72DF0